MCADSSSSGAESGVGLQENDDPFAIEQLTFCTDSRYLCIGGATSQVIGFRFSKHETHNEVPVIEIPMKYEDSEYEGSTDTEIACGMSSLLTQTSNESHDNVAQNYLLHVRSGHHKRLAGFQAEFVCLSPGVDSTTAPPYRITSLCVNSYANL
ncbi:unnamed protein product [Oppiella nova]|uniref:Uncharacterized protein n=1 Tax=Oppiella nova TaxID=334625 RepID=A0A7R9QSN0_9ACAR|nr:unnamed protein product [Oppiella nova]CAG2173940.1 unnamed protein product [Oppiella nova]